MSDTTSPNLPAALPWDDGVYSIKRHGVSLTNCDSEPVQTPGCIQAHGALLALRVSALTILQASENTLEHLGRAPEDLLGQTVSTVFGASANVRLREMLAHEPIERNALHAFTHPANGKRPSLNACLHTVDGLALLEFDADGQHATGASADTFAPVRSAVQRLQSVGSLRDFCSALAQEVRNLTHLDRVMVYRFHPDNHGEVFAECKREDLANMGVAASLTMSLMCDGELWGLIACHHCSPTQFHYSVRAACEFLAQVASLQLKSAEKREQLVYRLRIEGAHQALVGQAAVDGDLMALTDREPSLRDAVDCGGAALRHLDRWWCVGDTPSNAQLDTLADWLDDRPEFSSATRPVLAIDQLSRDFPAATNMVTSASGILAVPLSRQRRDLMVWFRPPADLTVRWAGNPQDKPLVPGPNGPRLTPRSSFALFVESVRGRSLPWSQMEVDSALRLRMLVMELVVSRAERLAELNADLTRSNDELDAFAYVASHDLKEPLRGIHKYAHQLLESAQALDSENRRRVDALMRLTLRMDSLPDSLLHFSRVGRTTLELEVVDLTTLLDQACEMVGARPAVGNCTINLPRRLPLWLCDRVRVREIFSNLLSNALKYKRLEAPHIELGYLTPDERTAPADAPAGTAGHTVFYLRDDGIGIEQRHFEQVFRLFKRLHGRDEFGGGVGAGLTIVHKLVQRHGGRIWLDSTPGVGTTFYFTLPCGDS